MRHSRDDAPMLITSAPESAEHEFDRRKRKYAIMMSLRAVCVLGAALTYQVSMYLAFAFVIGGIVLPWCAVIIANDGPVRKRPAPVTHRPVNTERALTSGDDSRTVDG